MRTTIDAHRSLARYLSEVLPEYDVWTGKTEPQEERPYAVVRPVQIQTTQQGSRILADVIQPFIVYLYPAIASDAVAGQHQKFLTEEALWEAFHVGIGKGFPLRVPLLDYTTGGEGGTLIPWDQSATMPEKPDYASVEHFELQSAQDAEDERRWSIMLTVRLAWRRYGRIFSGLPATGIKVKPEHVH